MLAEQLCLRLPVPPCMQSISCPEFFSLEWLDAETSAVGFLKDISLPQALPWVGGDAAGLCGVCAGLTPHVAEQVGFRQGSDTMVMRYIEFPGS